MKYLLLLVILALVGGGLWFQNALNRPVEHDLADTYLTIEPGTAATTIVGRLAARGVIGEPLATKIYLRCLAKEVRLEAGDYRFPSPVSALAVIDLLGEGRKLAENLTIPEGWTRFEVAKRIANRFFPDSAAVREQLNLIVDSPELIRSFDVEAPDLEGYLYPSTYQVDRDATPESIVGTLVRQFTSTWRPEWDTLARGLGRSRREIVTVASLIENESQLENERPVVASVIYNRLKRGIPLGIDATNVYIAKTLGRWDGILHRSDLTIEHPYNTRLNQGLPPGPISSPGRSALEAALRPDTTDYLYYVLNVDANDGSHHFYATGAGFARGKAAYQRWLAEQRRAEN